MKTKGDVLESAVSLPTGVFINEDYEDHYLSLIRAVWNLKSSPAGQADTFLQTGPGERSSTISMVRPDSILDRKGGFSPLPLRRWRSWVAKMCIEHLKDEQEALFALRSSIVIEEIAHWELFNAIRSRTNKNPMNLKPKEWLDALENMASPDSWLSENARTAQSQTPEDQNFFVRSFIEVDGMLRVLELSPHPTLAMLAYLDLEHRGLVHPAAKLVVQNFLGLTIFGKDPSTPKDWADFIGPSALSDMNAVRKTDKILRDNATRWRNAQYRKQMSLNFSTPGTRGHRILPVAQGRYLAPSTQNGTFQDFMLDHWWAPLRDSPIAHTWKALLYSLQKTESKTARSTHPLLISA